MKIATKLMMRASSLAPADGPPIAGLVRTFDYKPGRDGLALLEGGPSMAGYAADYVANPSRKWMPRMTIPANLTPGTKGDTGAGMASFMADPAYPWSNGFTPITVVDGALCLRAQTVTTIMPAFTGGEVPTNPATGIAHTWMSATISTEPAFNQYGGYWEAECKVPYGVGLWDSFFMFSRLRSSGSPANSQEIDVFEYLEPALLANDIVRTNYFRENYVQDMVPFDSNINLSLDFHKYGVYITDISMGFYLDDVLIRLVDISAKPDLQVPWFMLLSNQVGSTIGSWVGQPDGTTPNPADLLIRSVEVWQKPGPVFLNLSAVGYMDDLTVGQKVADISTTNYGGDDGYIYSIVADPDSMFTIVGSELRLAQVVLATADDTHPVTIRVTDAAGRTFTRLFTIKSYTALPIQANYITNQDLSNAFWSKGGVTINGTDTVQELATTEDHLIYPGAAGLLARTAGIKTMRVWTDIELQVGGPTLGFFQIFDQGYGAQCQGQFNLSAMTVGFVIAQNGWSAASGALIPLPNGKIRMLLDFTTDAVTTGLRVFIRTPPTNGANNWLGVISRRTKHSNIWVYNRGAGAGGS